MQLMMVVAAERQVNSSLTLRPRDLVARISVMGIAGRALADQAGLRADECEVALLAVSRRPAQRGHLFFGVRPLLFGDGAAVIWMAPNRSIAAPIDAGSAGASGRC